MGEEILQDFGNHKYDILLGTQMVSKGHDFKDVTAVGLSLIHIWLSFNSLANTDMVNPSKFMVILSFGNSQCIV